MAGLLRGSKRLLGVSRAFQGVSVCRTDCAAVTCSQVQFESSFATLPNKSRQTKVQAKKSDPDAAQTQSDQPKGRAASAFNFFFKDAFKAIKEEHPEKRPTVSTAMPQVSAQWKAMSAEEKQPYIDASLANKQSQPKSAKAQKVSKPLTAYNIFTRENFENLKARNPTLQPRQILMSMGREWKSLGASEKQKYKDKADKANQTAGTA